LVVGQGSSAAFVRRAKSLGIANRVTFTGRQSSIQRFYGAADLFVLPTIYEPFPNVNLEAMACGTPVITTATAGGAEIVHEESNGYLIPDAWAINELADKIDHHLALPWSRKQYMSDACWDAASRLRIVDNAQKVAAMFEEVLNERGRAAA
jgi:UDP-glucose:(heptosyl)LPS alpha-1,3-glucosyltransferase